MKILKSKCLTISFFSSINMFFKEYQVTKLRHTFHYKADICILALLPHLLQPTEIIPFVLFVSIVLDIYLNVF